MDGGSVGTAIPGAHNPAAYTKPRRRDSAIGLRADDPLLPARNQNTVVPHPPLSEMPEVENTLGGSLPIIEHSESCLANATTALPKQYEQIHNALLLSIKVIEDTTEKLYQSFEAAKNSNVFKKEDISEKIDTDFCLAHAISDFQALFLKVKEAIYELKTDSYSKDACSNLDQVSKELSSLHARLKHNLPPPQTKVFKIFNHILEGLGTVITIIAVALAGLGVAISTTAPCAAAAFICWIVKAWREKIALPEANKNMYLTNLEELYADTFSALKVMEDDVNMARIFELQEAQQRAQAQMAEQQLLATREQTQKILDAMSKPAVEKASPGYLVTVLASQDPNSLTEEQAKFLENWLHRRTPSPERLLDADGVSSSSQEHATLAALTGQA